MVGEEPAAFRQKPERRHDEVVGAALQLVTFDLLGDIAIYFKVYSQDLGIDSICVKGRLTVDMVQSGTQFGVPVIAHCLRAFFLDRPEVYLDSLRPALMAEHAELNAKICNTVSKAIDCLMVLPNMIALPLAADVNVFDIKSQRHQGVLHVHVRSGEDSLAVTMVGTASRKEVESQQPPPNPAKQSPLGLFGLTCSDSQPTPKDNQAPKRKGESEPEPGLEVRCGAEVGASSNEQPAFSQHFTFNTSFPICDVKRQRVSISLWEDRRSRTSALGKLELPVHDMTTWGVTEMTVILPEESKKVAPANRQLKLTAAWRGTLPVSSGRLDSISSSSTVWLLSVGIYGTLGLPRFGENTLHWISAECDHIALDDVVSLTKASHALAEGGPNGKSKVISNDDCSRALKQKLSILQTHGLSAASIARVLEVDDQFLAIDNAGDLMAHPGLGTQNLRWEQLFSFAITNPDSAELTVKLMRKPPGKDICETDKYTCQLHSLVRSDNHRIVQAAALKETGALLELQLELKPLGKPEGCLISM
jgi:hypothetical protein